MTDQETEKQEGQEDESGVIKALRQQVKDLQSELKNRPDSPDIDALVSERVQRRDAARDVLVSQGYSPKMTDLVLKNLDGDVTEENVTSFLDSIGLEAQSGEPEQKKPEPRPVSSVADLASQVASASAKDKVGDQTLKALNEAKNQAEIDALMRQAGLAQ